MLEYVISNLLSLDAANSFRWKAGRHYVIDCVRTQVRCGLERADNRLVASVENA